MKKRTFQTILRFQVFGCCFLLSLAAKAQNLDTTLNTYADQYGQEKVYLHYDKPAYAPGETIWFKAYLMEGLYPAESSKTLYVDWVDEKGKVLLHSVSPVVNATAHNQFDLPEDYAGKVVQVRAYTRWMLNFDSAFIYNHAVRVVSPVAKTPAAKPAIIPTLQFFPEGGEAVAGLVNKVAFKAADQWGLPVAVRGVIKNSKGAVVDSFRSVHNGMGSFLLQAQTGESYTAHWKDTKGAEHTTALPRLQPSGIALQVMVAGTRRQFTISRTADAGANLRQLYLVGTMNQRPAFRASVDLTAVIAKKGIIPTDNLPSGILTITVFDAGWNAIAERITFINNEEYTFNAEMNVQHWGLNKRARNEIQVVVPDRIEASLSVSVTDAAVKWDSSQNIISRLLLTSDLKGYVHNPAYYFTHNNDTLQQQLDVVMLTHGWRRFKWEDVVKGKMPAITFPRDTAYLSLSGKVYGVPPGSLTSGANIVMFLKERDSASRMVVTPIHANGTFKEPDLFFFDTLQVYYQLQPAKTLKGGDVRFMEERLNATLFKSFQNSWAYNPYTDTAGSYRQYLMAQENRKAGELMREKMLANVTVQARTKTPAQAMDEKYASGLFRGSDGYQFDLVNDVTSAGYGNIFNYLTGKVAGLQITGGGANVSLQWRGARPALFLDEMPTDVDLISSIPVTDIAYVKVLRPPFLGAVGGGSGGAIAIYTRKGNDVASTPGKGLSSLSITGYTPVKEFYAPNYSTFSQRNEQQDLRTTLYWNPMVQTTPKQKTVTLTFYNNDISKAFRVVIEGMTRDGRLVHVEQVME